MNVSKPAPLTLAELKKLRKPLKNIYSEHKRKLTGLQKFAINIANHVGTMGFFIIIFVWTLLWLGWNTFGPEHLRFDPYPAFVLWLFISNMIQLFLLPMILISQNSQDKIFEERALADYEVNVKAEREIEAILEHLEYQNEMVINILKKLEK